MSLEIQHAQDAGMRVPEQHRAEPRGEIDVAIGVDVDHVRTLGARVHDARWRRAQIAWLVQWLRAHGRCTVCVADEPTAGRRSRWAAQDFGFVLAGLDLDRGWDLAEAHARFRGLPRNSPRIRRTTRRLEERDY